MLGGVRGGLRWHEHHTAHFHRSPHSSRLQVDVPPSEPFVNPWWPSFPTGTGSTKTVYVRTRTAAGTAAREVVDAVALIGRPYYCSPPPPSPPPSPPAVPPPSQLYHALNPPNQYSHDATTSLTTMTYSGGASSLGQGLGFLGCPCCTANSNAPSGATEFVDDLTDSGGGNALLCISETREIPFLQVTGRH